VAPKVWLRGDELVGEALTIALRMIVGQVLLDRIIQGAFTQHDHLLRRLLLDGAHKPFTVGVEIRTPRRQGDWLHPVALEQAIEHPGEFGVPIVDERPFPEGIRRRDRSTVERMAA
jgi:hypothetical protein